MVLHQCITDPPGVVPLRMSNVNNLIERQHLMMISAFTSCDLGARMARARELSQSAQLCFTTSTVCTWTRILLHPIYRPNLLGDCMHYFSG